jgi:hypothetical protein
VVGFGTFWFPVFLVVGAGGFEPPFRDSYATMRVADNAGDWA